ncbi:hypothetical protein DBB29_12335 [Pandoraea cepalis]|uniref:Uncharacterized protein n=1 Tax=Pandoraea cepalis TaxID=2508294 RepID=A0AAW7MH38_9BURK|nr:hypothetical protein [Pandoraea cepalis]MDN4572057.1 hypothetical protein [Pandoraea cepalis]MDN4578903.1 hypothetical protein [Pandoraea cepalis]
MANRIDSAEVESVRAKIRRGALGEVLAHVNNRDAMDVTELLLSLGFGVAESPRNKRAFWQMVQDVLIRACRSRMDGAEMRELAIS